MKTCRPGAHVWESMRGGRERCRECNTTYPCLLECDHADCRADKNQPMPEGVRLVEAS